MIQDQEYKGAYLSINKALLSRDEAKSIICHIMDSLREEEESIPQERGNVRHKTQMIFLTILSYDIMYQVISDSLSRDLKLPKEIFCYYSYGGAPPLLEKIMTLKMHLKHLDIEMETLCIGR